jgi:hypothetical protein
MMLICDIYSFFIIIIQIILILTIRVIKLNKNVTESDVFFLKKKHLEFTLFDVGPDANGKNVIPTGVFQFFF